MTVVTEIKIKTSIEDIALKMVRATIQGHRCTTGEIIERLLPWARHAGVTYDELRELIEHIHRTNVPPTPRPGRPRPLRRSRYGPVQH